MWSESELPRPTEDLQLIKRDLAQHGYALLANFLCEEEVRRARDRLLEQAAAERRAGVAWLGPGPGSQSWIGAPKTGETEPWQAIRCLPNKGKVFQGMIVEPRLMEILRHGFQGEDFYLSGSTGNIILNGSSEQDIHIDQAFLPDATPRPYVMNALVMLSDFTEANGATRVVPASHLGPPPPKGRRIKEAGKIATVAAEGPAGTALIFEGRLWHGAGRSVSNSPRYRISLYYALCFLRQQDNYPASVQDAVFDGMPEEVKAMIGFKTSAGLGKIDARSGGDRSNLRKPLPYVPELHK